MIDDLVVCASDWPHGLRCMDCDTRMREGQRYSRRLVAMVGRYPVVQIVCVPCGLGMSRD